MVERVRLGHQRKVGYAKPPKDTRWKPGQSGNPRGRPKGSKNLVTILNDALNKTLTVQENGRTRKISAREGIVMRLINAAIKGDLKAIALLLGKPSEIGRSIEPVKRITDNMTAAEAATIYAESLRRD
jgi:hypothetical protein